MSLQATTSQTVGPFFKIGFEWLNCDNLVGEGVSGERVTVQGRVIDGDGRPDILVTHLAQEYHSLWRQHEQPGTFADVAGEVGLTQSKWRGTGWGTFLGDFNHDGHSDILWQNANGQASIWEMNGSNVTGGGPVAANPGPSWLAL